jgi:hypothetical protein
MSAPVEYTPGQRAFRWLGPVLIASGIALWAGIPLWQAVKTGVMYSRQIGGPFPFVRYAGVALTILGALLFMKAKDPSPPALERYDRNGSVRAGGKPSTARVVAIHSKSMLFGPWIEVYATLEVQEPSYTVKTTVILNRSELPSLRVGATVPIRVDREDRDEIALLL